MIVALSEGRCSFPERCTDWYIITMLLVFPLFPGFSGYAAITLSKFVFFAVATGLWSVVLFISLLCGHFRPLRFPQYAALAYLGILIVSWLLSPDRATAFLGAGRYDGFLSSTLYVIIFLGVSTFARNKLLYAKVATISVSLCALIALFQIGGGNPLHLYPEGLGYFDSGIRYSGAFLGTVGNTNILDALMCLSLPVFLALYVCGSCVGFLIPVLLCVPLLQKAGGDGAYLAMALTLLPALPLLLTEQLRLRRCLSAFGSVLLALALAHFWSPTGEHAFAFLSSQLVWLLSAIGVICIAMSFLPVPKRFSPTSNTLRTISLCVSVALLLAGVLTVCFSTDSSGTLYELRQLLHGHVDGSFGSSRIHIWRECLKLVPERPLLGGGPGTVSLRLNIQFSRYVPETGQTLSSYVDNAHNVYLGTLVNTGLFGLAGLLFILVVSAFSGIRRRSDPLPLAVSLGAMCCAIHEFFGLGLCLSSPLLWLALGLINTLEQPQLATVSEACYEQK